MTDTSPAKLRDEYANSLADLKFNSKPMISMLTMLAGDYKSIASDIVKLIEQRITQVPADRKLLLLYLLDSICKNLADVYVDLFAENVVHTFCHVFEKGDEKIRASLFKLRQTWTSVFGTNKLYQMDLRIKKLDPAWPITAPAPHSGTTTAALPVSPTPGDQPVHVNPRFLGENKSGANALETEIASQLIQKQQELLNLQRQKADLDRLTRVRENHHPKKNHIECVESEMIEQTVKKRTRPNRSQSPNDRKRRNAYTRWNDDNNQSEPQNGSPPTTTSAVTKTIQMNDLLPINTTSNTAISSITPHGPVTASVATSILPPSTSMLPIAPPPIIASITASQPPPPSLIAPQPPMPTANSCAVPNASRPVHLPITSLPLGKTSHMTAHPMADSSAVKSVYDLFRCGGSDIDYRNEFNNLRQKADQRLHSGALSRQDHSELINEMERAMQQQIHQQRCRQSRRFGPEELTMLVDGKSRKLFYIDDHVAIVLMNCPIATTFEELRLRNPMDFDVRQISFEGPPSKVFVDNDMCLLLAFDGQWIKFMYLDNEQHIKFGGPAREVYMNGRTIRCKFGGSPVQCWLNGDLEGMHTIRLDGPPPRVKLSDQPRPDLWIRLVDAYALPSAPMTGHAISSIPMVASNQPTITIPGLSPPPPQLPTLSSIESGPDASSSVAPVNVNDLLSKLMAVGIIPAKPNSPSDSSEQDSVAVESTNVRATHAFIDKIKPERPRTDSSNEHQTRSPDTKPHSSYGRHRNTRKSELEVKETALRLDTEVLKQRRPSLIEQLYRGTQCTNCSLRFDLNFGSNAEELAKAKTKYAAHLDWHFRQNRKVRNKPANAIVAAKRPWYYPADLWMQFRETAEEDDPTGPDGGADGNEECGASNLESKEKTSLPLIKVNADESLNACAVCYERFEQIWCEDEDEWKLLNAVQPETGSKCFHPSCLNDLTTQSINIKDESIDTSTAESNETPAIENSDPDAKDTINAGLVDPEPVQESEELKDSPIIELEAAAGTIKTEGVDISNTQSDVADEVNMSNGQVTDEKKDESERSELANLTTEDATITSETNHDADALQVNAHDDTNTSSFIESDMKEATSNFIESDVKEATSNFIESDVKEPTLSTIELDVKEATSTNEEEKNDDDGPEQIRVEIIGLDIPFVATDCNNYHVSNHSQEGIAPRQESTTISGLSMDTSVECQGSSALIKNQAKPILLKLSVKESNLEIVNRNQAAITSTTTEALASPADKQNATEETLAAVSEISVASPHSVHESADQNSPNHSDKDDSLVETNGRTNVLINDREISGMCTIM